MYWPILDTPGRFLFLIYSTFRGTLARLHLAVHNALKVAGTLNSGISDHRALRSLLFARSAWVLWRPLLTSTEMQETYICTFSRHLHVLLTYLAERWQSALHHELTKRRLCRICGMRQVFCFVSDYKSSATLHSSVISQPLYLCNAIKIEIYKLPRTILDGLFFKMLQNKRKISKTTITGQ